MQIYEPVIVSAAGGNESEVTLVVDPVETIVIRIVDGSGPLRLQRCFSFPTSRRHRLAA